MTNHRHIYATHAQAICHNNIKIVSKFIRLLFVCWFLRERVREHLCKLGGGGLKQVPSSNVGRDLTTRDNARPASKSRITGAPQTPHVHIFKINCYTLWRQSQWKTQDTFIKSITFLIYWEKINGHNFECTDTIEDWMN